MKYAFLVGNPNSGKTAVLNALTGSTYTVGNWAGVTVTKQKGELELPNAVFSLTDLPGLYSLDPCSEDESIAAKEVFFSHADVFLNVIDINNLHQNLMLSAELAELGVPMIGLLNFADEFFPSHDINLNALEEELGFPVIPFSARTGQGIKRLRALLTDTPDYSVFCSKKRLCKHSEYAGLEQAFHEINGRILLASFAPSVDKKAVLAQVARGNGLLMSRLVLSQEHYGQIIDAHQDTLPDITQDFLDRKEILVRSACISVKKGAKDNLAFTRLADRLFMHPLWGIVSFFGIMVVMFMTVFNAANPFIDFVDWLIGGKIAGYASAFLADTPPALRSFIAQGIIGGVGGVLTFVPLIYILYICLAFLEESGYLARIAVLLEVPLSKIGFSGKAFLPLMLGFGCNVPAIKGSRVLETPQQRRLTAMIAPLMSCGARLTVFALFAAAFFPKHGSLVLISMYLIGIFFALFFGWFLSRFPHFRSGDPCFVMVLPPYRVPNCKVMLRTAWLHASSYIKNAGGIILGMLMLIWVFSYFPAQGKVSESYLAKAGRVLTPIFVPLGFGERWEPVVSIVPSLVAKEAVVGFLGQTLSTGEDIEEEAEPMGSLSDELLEIAWAFANTVKDAAYGVITFNIADLFAPPDTEALEAEGGEGVIQKLANLWENNPLAPAKAYSYMLFILLTLPCVASIAVLKQELDEKTFWLSMVFYLALPYAVSLVFYQSARLFIG